jgi:hypothetical protein
MQGYYVRPEAGDVQENKDFSLDILRDIVTGDALPLGPDAKGLIEKINEFIVKNKFNIETDLETIVSKLAEDVPIRQKLGGVCIKSSLFRECSIDAETNELYCAYNVCPNVFHFYYMVDLTYQQFTELKKTMDLNEKRGLIKQVKKDKNMLSAITRKRLIPELKELHRMIDKKGIEDVIKRHPDLLYVIENSDKVQEEVEKWI